MTENKGQKTESKSLKMQHLNKHLFSVLCHLTSDTRHLKPFIACPLSSVRCFLAPATM